jgi:hypothetical protein
MTICLSRPPAFPEVEELWIEMLMRERNNRQYLLKAIPQVPAGASKVIQSDML